MVCLLGVKYHSERKLNGLNGMVLFQYVHGENGTFQKLQESLFSVHTIIVYTSSSECSEMWRRGRVLQGVGVLIHLEPGLWYSNGGAGPCTAQYCTSGPSAISLSRSHSLSDSVSGSNTVLTATFINSLSVRGRASPERASTRGKSNF